MLKQLLQQLLNTRTTPGGVAHSASSTYTSPQWFNGTSTVGDKWTNGLYTGTAPNDGYLNISGSAYITTENVGSMIQAQIGDGQISQVSPMSGQGFNMLFPISKGASFSVNGIRLTDITVRFFKTIGGGRKIIRLTLQGGVLCRLSHWYSSLRKNSCKVRKGGLQTNQQFLFKILLNYLLLQMEKVTHLRCRTQGSLTSEVMEFGLPILEGSTLSILGRLRMGTFLFGLTPKKVKNSPTQLGNQTSSLLPIFVYTKSKVTIDLMFGGASC